MRVFSGVRVECVLRRVLFGVKVCLRWCCSRAVGACCVCVRVSLRVLSCLTIQYACVCACVFIYYFLGVYCCAFGYVFSRVFVVGV